MTIQGALQDILHNRPLHEVIQYLLEVDCPVCADPDFYVGVVGPSCPDKGCVHYNKAASKGWQQLVKDSVRDPNNLEKFKKAIDASLAAKVNKTVIEKSGLDLASVYDYVSKKHPVGSTRSVEKQFSKALKRNLNVLKYTSSSWQEEYLSGQISPSKILYHKHYLVEFGPLLNDKDVEMWARKTWSSVIRLATDSWGGYWIEGILKRRKSGHITKLALYEIYSHSVASSLEKWGRLAADELKALYWLHRALPRAKTQGATKGYVKPYTVSAAGTGTSQLQIGDIVVSRGAPSGGIAVKVHQGPFDVSDTHEVTDIIHNTPSTYIILMIASSGQHVEVEAKGTSNWEVTR